MDLILGISARSSFLHSSNISIRKLTELLLLLEESAVEGVSSGIIEKFEVVEDLDNTTTLYADDTTENPRRYGRSISTVGGVGRRRLGFDTSVVIRYAKYHQRMELKCQATTRR
ncbi:hypothetical protein H5410_039292 [Solanum commersonii]|uniref:Uncharacterized protein n=1 Tax=Solanum commersonii TaxID=4109 RepID=A0A9J5YFN2_SOLCO|nr:hypothetical protein H5410_039292 [Solanum commersonii]